MLAREFVREGKILLTYICWEIGRQSAMVSCIVSFDTKKVSRNRNMLPGVRQARRRLPRDMLVYHLGLRGPAQITGPLTIGWLMSGALVASPYDLLSSTWADSRGMCAHDRDAGGSSHRRYVAGIRGGCCRNPGAVCFR